jgi:hypothetical protein
MIPSSVAGIMTEQKPTLGGAIDQLLAILEPLDGDTREVAVNTVCTVLKIAKPSASVQSEDRRERIALASAGGARQPPAPPSPQRDIRSLKEEKRPRSAKEMACLVAFYLQEYAAEGERKDTIATEDLEKYFKQASFKLPKALQQVLPDAKASGYFDTPSRGAYKLNAVGYNLVAHTLPAADAGA